MARKSWALAAVVVLFSLAASNMVAQPAAKGKGGGFKSPLMSALTYWADPYLLVAHEEIVKDLKLDAKQQATLKKALAEYQEVVPAGGKKGGAAATMAKRQEAAKKLEDTVRDVLGDKVKRLDQIAAQGAGLPGFFTGVKTKQDKLDLTAEQVAKAKEIVDGAYTEMLKKANMDGGKASLVGVKGAELRSVFIDAATPKLLGLLSNDQNKRWLDLVGDPVQPEVLLKVRTSAAGFGFAGFDPAPIGGKGKSKGGGPVTAVTRLAASQRALGAGNYAEAEDFARKALELCKEENLQRGDALAAVGAALCKLNRPADAQKMLDDALALYGKLVGPFNPRIANTHSWLGVCAELRGQLDKAETLQRKALDIHEKVEGPNSPEAAQNWTNLGNLAIRQKKLADAEKHHRKALEIHEKAANRDDRLIAATTYHLAVVYRALDKVKEAEAHALRAVEIYDQASPNHADLVLPLRLLTEVCIAQKRWADAEKHVQKWLRLTERSSAAPDSSLEPLDRLASILTALGRTDEAAAVNRRKADLKDRLAAQKPAMP